MYRPNRIGPWPLVTLESSLWDPTGATVGTNSGAITGAPIYMAQDAVANEATNARNIQISGTITLGAAKQICVGVKIIGSALFEDGKYLLSYGGSFMMQPDVAGVGLSAIVGRVAANGAASGALDNWAHVPLLNHKAADGGNHRVYADANGTVILGDWKPEGTILTTEYYFGWFMTNMSVNEAIIKNAMGSMSLHRYEQDINTLDPNR